jgi:methionyl-tRNA synthetase
MRTYLTVAIPYVNAEPHLGYAYELVLADVYARAGRRAGDEVRFLGGTDDYSLKNVLAAEAAGVSTSELVARLAERFERLAELLGVSFDDFIRTSSDARHRPSVERLWRACAERGDLYTADYEGDYCVSCEQFWNNDELLGGRCPEHLRPVERIAEQNWFFRLSSYQDDIEDLIASRRLVIHPEPFREEVLAFVRRGLEDLSISRSARRARGWGIPVPEDPEQVVYVWFDALANYLSALRYGDLQSSDHRRWWQEADQRVHVVGKGIVRFHAVYWPAFLASAGELAPTRVEVHPYLTAGGEKLSKSQGRSIDPASVVAAYGTDALRWWFARDVSPLADTDFSTERLVARADEDLANGLGNVTNRVASLVHRNRGLIPLPAGAPPLGELTDLEHAVQRSLSRFDLRSAAGLVLEAVATLNRSLEITKPWQLPSSAELAVLLGAYLSSIEIVARAVAPIVPSLHAILLDRVARARRGEPPRPAFARLGG